MSSLQSLESKPLQPVRRWWLRFLIVAAIATLASISPRVRWPIKLIGAACWAGLIGSYPQARIRGDQFEREMVIMFLPVRVKRWTLDRFSGIQPESEPPDEFAVGWWWLFGNWWILWQFFDWLIPWLGGPYKLWLRAASGKRVLAWQGNSERQFRANLDLLLNRTGLSIEA